MLEIYVARHGQNEDNANGILNGHRDLPLTEIGEAQAEALAEGIMELGVAFDKVYSSPLIRAYDTAKKITEALHLPEPTIMPELIERDFGVMTGVPQSEIAQRCSPDIIQTETITYFLSPDGAETFPDLVERANTVLQKLGERHKEGSLLLVGHGDFGKMIYAAATHQDWESVLRDFHFGNGELIEVSLDGDAHKIKLPQHNT
jgi:broad specificity phosphatase PhoE